MADSKLLQQISRKGSNKEQIAEQVIEQPDLLSEIFEGLNSDQANIKYGCDKILRRISEKAPELLYPHFGFFANNLSSENTFFKWGAIHILANLAAVDAENKFEKIFDDYFAPIPGPVLITAANVIKGAAKIASAKPHLAERIAQALLPVEKAKYQNAECRNIALGQVIKTVGQFFDQIKDKEPMIKLVRKQLKNSRNATKKVAETFMKKNL
jgi:hypothetical protein